MNIQEVRASARQSAERADTLRKCQSCSVVLSGRQRMFCSRRCKNQSGNKKNQNYRAQRTRGLERKREIVAAAGGSCMRCGYSNNLAALVFHHRSPSEKSFNLDLRALSNRSPGEIRSEFLKCDLLCANCHAELHNPTAPPKG